MSRPHATVRTNGQVVQRPPPIGSLSHGCDVTWRAEAQRSAAAKRRHERDAAVAGPKREPVAWRRSLGEEQQHDGVTSRFLQGLYRFLEKPNVLQTLRLARTDCVIEPVRILFIIVITSLCCSC